MSTIKNPAKRAFLFLGQDDLPRNPSVHTFRKVQMNGAGTAKACSTVYCVNRELMSEMLSFMSNQNLSASVNCDTVILMQISAEKVLVLSVVNRRWILICYDMQSLPADRVSGLIHHNSLYLPGKSATCVYSYADTVAYLTCYVAAPVIQRDGSTSITQLIDPLLFSKLRAEQILDALQSYGQHIGSSVQCAIDWKGRDRFLPQIQRRVGMNKRIQMILPSFPWKSVSIALSNDYIGFC